MKETSFERNACLKGLKERVLRERQDEASSCDRSEQTENERNGHSDILKITNNPVFSSFECGAGHRKT